MLLAEPGLKMRWLSFLLWSCVCKALCVRAVYQSQILECTRGLVSSLLVSSVDKNFIFFGHFFVDSCRSLQRIWPLHKHSIFELSVCSDNHGLW